MKNQKYIEKEGKSMGLTIERQTLALEFVAKELVLMWSLKQAIIL